MNCKNACALMGAYLDAELGGQETLAIRAHLHNCPYCAAELDTLKSVKRILTRLPEPEMSPEFAVRLHQSVFTSPYQAAQPVIRWALIGAATAALALLWAGRLDGRDAASLGARSVPGGIARDQAYSTGGDMLNGQFPLMPVSHDLD